MKIADPARAAQTSVRDQLLDAARREHAASSPVRTRRRWRRRSRFGAAVVAVLLGATVAAGATDLISVGAPLPDISVKQPDLAPPAGSGPALVLKAADPAAGLAWGVGIYTSPSGKDCALAGEVRGLTLGRMRDGRFHPYERGTTGACGDLGKLPMLMDALQIDGRHPRTIVYGRVGPATRAISIDDHGTRRSIKPGAGGAFIFVVSGVFTKTFGFRNLDVRVE